MREQQAVRARVCTLVFRSYNTYVRVDSISRRATGYTSVRARARVRMRAHRSATCVERNISRCHRWWPTSCTVYNTNYDQARVPWSVPLRAQQALESSLSRPVFSFVCNKIYTDVFFSSSLRRSFLRKLGRFRGQTETCWKETKSTPRFLGTYSADKCVRIRATSRSNAIQVRKCFCPA